MFDLINGVPVHPLVVHAVVVLLPLTILGALVMVFKPAWRLKYGHLVAAELFHQIQAEIERSMHTAAAVEAAVFSHHQLGHPLYFGISFTELIGQAPVCGSAFAVKQARGRD